MFSLTLRCFFELQVECAALTFHVKCLQTCVNPPLQSSSILASVGSLVQRLHLRAFSGSRIAKKLETTSRPSLPSRKGEHSSRRICILSSPPSRSWHAILWSRPANKPCSYAALFNLRLNYSQGLHERFFLVKFSPEAKASGSLPPRVLRL